MRSGIEPDFCPAPSPASEWLETNGLGDYASATTQGINTRKYHGLLIATVERLDRHILLSTLEDWLCVGGESYPLSARHHPGAIYPDGLSTLRGFAPAPCPSFTYEAAGYRVTRSVALVEGSHTVLIRYELKSLSEAVQGPVFLRLTPLLAFRSYHNLTHANMDLQVKTYPVASGVHGFKIQPYNVLPPLFVQADGQFDFLPSPEWVNVVEYPVEQARGFDFQEDLFSPGLLEIPLQPGGSVVLSASAEDLHSVLEPGRPLSDLWEREMTRRAEKTARSEALKGYTPLQAKLARQSEAFLMRTPCGRNLILAGFPWFGSWGRDTLIALPGVTFLAGRTEAGLKVLKTMARNGCAGIIPNTFDIDGRPGGYNSVDASLWFAWACQLMLAHLKKTGREDDYRAFLDICAPAVSSLVAAYRAGRVPFARVASSGMLEVGTPATQLTWMDAQVDGRPVTPRWGFPVEIQALWYNTLCFGHELAALRNEPEPCPKLSLPALKAVFAAKFIKPDGSLVDVWRFPEDGGPDAAVRPNQLLAVSLPYPIAPEGQWQAIADKVTQSLLTPYGLRTLSPDHPSFRPRYEGGCRERDGAYHQGTVWPWLLGPYTDALLAAASLAGQEKTDQAARTLLETITPLVTSHLDTAGVGHISEIFSATELYSPDGAFAQAWSEGEVLRMLLKLSSAAPDVYGQWEDSLA